MNKQEIKTIVNEAVTLRKQMMELDDKIYELFGYGDTPYLNYNGVLFDAYLRQASINIGDNHDWLSWFIFENDCGEKGLKIIFREKYYTINNVDDFIKYCIRPTK